MVYTSWSFLQSWLITGFVTRLTRRVALVEQDLLTLPEHLGSPPVFSGVRVTQSLVLCVCYVYVFCPFVLFLLAIVLSVLLWYMDSDYPFGISKLFLHFKLMICACMVSIPWSKYTSVIHSLYYHCNHCIYINCKRIDQSTECMKLPKFNLIFIIKFLHY